MSGFSHSYFFLPAMGRPENCGLPASRTQAEHESGPPALPGKQCKLFLTIWEWKGSSASKNSHWVNSQKCLEVHPFGNVKWMELQIWKILHVGFYKTSTYFFNGLYLSLKNPESIQSTLESFFFFFFSKQSPRQLSTFAAADERGSDPQKQDHKERSCS